MSIILGETPNPVPICLGIMSHEQKEKGSEVFWDSHKDWSHEAIEPSYFKDTLPISSSIWPRVKQEVQKSQEKDVCNSRNKKDMANGKLMGRLLL